MSRAAYLLTLLLLAVFLVLSPSAAVIAALAALLLIPLASWGMLLILRRKLRLEITAPATAQKGEGVRLEVRRRYGGLLPMGRLELAVTVENSVTGQRLCRVLGGSGLSGWEVKSEFCGCLTVTVERARVYDLFGLLWVNVRKPKEKRVVILPGTFPVFIGQDSYPAPSVDAQEYAPDRRGQDRTETYQVRGYVPGDSLAQIHWKLSSKLDTLMVREPGCPVDRDLMVFVDRGWQTVSPERADAIMEAAVSVCQSLSEAAVPFSLVWNEESIAVQEVTEQDRLPEAVGALLKSRTQGTPGTEVYLGLYGPPRVSRIIYIGASMPENLEVFGGQSRMVCLICANLGDLDGVICFTPENLPEALAEVSWI